MLQLDTPAPTSSPRSSPLLFGLRRLARPIIVASIVLLGLCYYGTTPSSKPTFARVATFPSHASNTHSRPTSQGAKDFWDVFSTAIAKAKPSFEEVNIKDHDDLYIPYNPDREEARPDLVEMSTAELAQMKALHKGIVEDIRTSAPRLPFVHGTRGIVVSVGNDGLTIFTTSLRMLRISGCTLPVEVFTNEYERIPCVEIFPSLGARCVWLKDQMREDAAKPLKPEKYGYKAASIAFSSFEQVLYMDNDLFPVMDPVSLFDAEPFNSSGMVLWPDYWASTTSPLYYQIAGVDAPDLRDRASTESGAILINKSTHSKSILLTIYYNIYTWGLYYRLFGQGAMGEGDKETWAAAARVFNLSFYQVNEAPAHIGYHCDGRDRSIASAQHHAQDDWFLINQGVQRRPDSQALDDPKPRVLFIHGNLPKYDVANILEWWMPALNWTDTLRCDNGRGTAHRLWGSKSATVAKYGWDVEKHVWDSMRWVACEHGMDYDMWENGTWHSEPKRGMCEKIVGFYEELLPDETYEAEVVVQTGYQTFVG